jgi:GDP/UDP-N,N'-diacetylbacillosamine 2-epimerase (hydrolysing)
MKKKICIITGSRAEWGLFYPLAGKIKKERNRFKLQIIAAGSHFSKTHGNTYKEILKDGFSITKAAPLTLSQDTGTGIANAFGTAVGKLSKSLTLIRPDLVMLLGDRFETFAAAVACLYTKLPVAHIHGGESTEGSLDDMMRHAVTKLSHIHFVAHEQYRKRVIQMGEHPSRVFCVGALALDNITGKRLLNKEAVEKKLGFNLNKRTVLVAFNPPTAVDRRSAEKQLRNLLDALDDVPDIRIIFTKSSPDMYSKALSRILDEYVSKRRENCIIRASLGRELYLSALNYAAAVIGNSSSAILEAPSFGIPTVDIGDRQKGRLRATSVINCRPKKGHILKAIKKALTEGFMERCRSVKNPYYKGNTAKNIVSVLKKLRIDNGLLKKRFYDL